VEHINKLCVNLCNTLFSDWRETVQNKLDRKIFLLTHITFTTSQCTGWA